MEAGEQCQRCGNDYDPMHPCQCSKSAHPTEAELIAAGFCLTCWGYGYNLIGQEGCATEVECSDCNGTGEAAHAPREELPNCVWRGAATPFADNH